MNANQPLPSSPLRCERRAAARYACRGDDTRLLVLSHRHESRWARPRDVSLTGIGLDVSGPFESGALALLQFSCRTGMPLTLVAQVVHTAPGTNGSWTMGCRFDSLRGDLGQHEREQLLEFFRQPPPGYYAQEPLPRALADKLHTSLPPLLQVLKQRLRQAAAEDPEEASAADPNDGAIEYLFDLLLIARGRLRLYRQPVALADLLVDMLKGTPLRGADPHRRCTALFPEVTLHVAVDVQRLAWVCATLLAEVAGRDGPLRLAAERDGPLALLRISGSAAPTDDGPLPSFADVLGCPIADRDRASRREQIRLALARGLVELHGGTVERQPTAHGAGSEFVLRLPLLPAATDPLKLNAPVVALHDELQS